MALGYLKQLVFSLYFALLVMYGLPSYAVSDGLYMRYFCESKTEIYYFYAIDGSNDLTHIVVYDQKHRRNIVDQPVMSQFGNSKLQSLQLNSKLGLSFRCKKV